MTAARKMKGNSGGGLRGKKRSKLEQHSFCYIMLAPFLILFFVFVFLPVFSSILLSFTDFNMLQVPKFVGLDNYSRLFLQDSVFMIALQNTIVFAVITGPLGYILSFVVAWLISDLRRFTRTVVTLIMYSPVLAGNVYFIWTFIFSGDSKGLMNNMLIQLGVIRDPVLWLTDERFNLTICILVMLWLSLGTGFLAFVAGFQSMDRSLFEAGSIDGVHNRWQELWYITIPQMGPQLLFGAVMSISGAFAVGDQCAALTGFPSTNYSTHTILLHMRDYGTIRFEMGYSSTIAVVLFAMMLLTWMVISKLFRKISD